VSDLLTGFVLAHDWGWDEILYFAVPVTLVLWWVRWAEKRAAARKAAEPESETPEPGDPPA
jgi:hypothetical protein